VNDGRSDAIGRVSRSDDYERLLEHARRDEEIVGVILGGSRGKGFETARSDWDVYLLTIDGADPTDVRSRYDNPPAIDLASVQTLTGFAAYALAGHPDEWNRYTFAHLTPPFDRTGGELADLCAAKELIPPDIARERAALALDGYINSAFRCRKNARDGRGAASHLDASESIPYLLDFAFLSEGRIRPYNKYLDWELTHHPLQESWPAASQTALLDVVTRNDRSTQAGLFREVESAARRLGYGDVIDAWHASDLVELRQD
jgi:hypothetical protein